MAATKTSIRLIVNGKEETVEANPTDRLADLVREKLELTGTKVSCGIGRCGACSVLLDGALVNSCLVMAYQADGGRVTTIEGVTGSGDTLDPVQQAFMEEGGFQCGYCTPGMIVAVKALLADNPEPTDEEIAAGLAGNLCRCTGYTGIVRAVRRVGKRI